MSWLSLSTFHFPLKSSGPLCFVWHNEPHSRLFDRNRLGTFGSVTFQFGWGNSPY